MARTPTSKNSGTRIAPRGAAPRPASTAADTLPQSEQNYRQIFNATTDAIFVHDADTMAILDVNEAMLQLFGCSREEALQLNTDTGSRGTSPYSAVEARQWVVRALTLGPQLFEWHARKCSGELFWVEVVLKLATLSGQRRILAFIRDITERKRTEDALSRTALEWQTTFDSTLDAIWLLDRNHRIVRSNKMAQVLFQRSNDEIIGKPCWEVMHGTTCQALKCPARRAATTRRRESLHDQMGERWLAIHVDPILDLEGHLSGFVHIVRDITATRAAAEREKRQFEQLLQSERLASLGTLVAGVAHEINNPNMFIMLNTPILQDILKDTWATLQAHHPRESALHIGQVAADELQQTAEKIFTNIVQGSSRIQNIVMELKTYAREMPTTLDERVDLNRTVRSAVTLVWNRIKSASDYFTAVYAEDLPLLHGNVQRIEQTVINLLTNACESLTDRNQAIRMETSHDPRTQTVAIRIVDEGCGMTPEVLARIRDPFFTTRRDAGGTGLGVSIIARIIAEHGGTLSYESQPGQGTTVTVTLPVQTGTREAHEPT